MRLMLLTTAIVGVSSFLLLPSVPVTPAARHTRLFATEQEEGNFFTRFFTELDNFVDDATARRLGNGSEFYGKRKSTFYGKDDRNRKRNSRVASVDEDYQGPTNTGYFVWKKDETGRVTPFTKMKKKKVESMIKPKTK